MDNQQKLWDLINKVLSDLVIEYKQKGYVTEIGNIGPLDNMAEIPDRPGYTRIRNPLQKKSLRVTYPDRTSNTISVWIDPDQNSIWIANIGDSLARSEITITDLTQDKLSDTIKKYIR